MRRFSLLVMFAAVVAVASGVLFASGVPIAAGSRVELVLQAQLRGDLSHFAELVGQDE